MSIGAVPGVLGACLVVSDSAALALLSPAGLTPGTQVLNAGVGAYFVLTTSEADLVTDQVVAVSGIAGARWIIGMTLADAAKLSSVVAGNKIPQDFVGATIDLTAAPGTTAIVIPARGPGVYLKFWLSRFFGTKNGTSASAAPIWKLGTNGAHDNLSAAGPTMSTANLNQLTGNFSLSTGFATTGSPTIELASDLVMEITQSAVGPTLTGRVEILGVLTTTP